MKKFKLTTMWGVYYPFGTLAGVRETHKEAYEHLDTDVHGDAEHALKIGYKIVPVQIIPKEIV